MVKTKKIIIKGIVQGIGFRSFAHFYALRYNIAGYVKNLEDGSLETVAKANEEDLRKYIEKISEGPTGILITKFEITEVDDKLINYDDFKIVR